MGFAFGSVSFHKGSVSKKKKMTCKTVFPMTLASGKNKVKCFLGLWLLQTQALLEGGYNFSSLFNNLLLTSVGPDLLRPVIISSSKTIPKLKLPRDLICLLLENLDISWTGLMLGENRKSPIQEGFVTVIMRSTFSTWIKQTIFLDYQSSSSDSQDTWIEAKDGILPEQISGSCCCRSHNSLLHSTWKM